MRMMRRAVSLNSKVCLWVQSITSTIGPKRAKLAYEMD
jgi:hypothetical protein